MSFNPYENERLAAFMKKSWRQRPRRGKPTRGRGKRGGSAARQIESD